MQWKINEVIEEEKKVFEIQDMNDWLLPVRKIIGDQPLIAYKYIKSWASICKTNSNAIVLCPSLDQFDSIRYELGSKYGVNSYAECLIETLKIIDARYGIDITGVGYRTVEFTLKEIPQGIEAVLFLKELYRFSESVLEGIVNVNAENLDTEEDDLEYLLEHYHLGNGRIALWLY